MMNKLIQWDTELFLYLNNMGTDFWDPFWIKVSEVTIWIPLYGLLIFLIVKKLKGRQIWLALLALGINTVITDQGSVWLFKEQFMRLRPCHVEALMDHLRLVKGSCGGKFGFISSHASNTFGLAVLVGMLLRPYYRFLLPGLLLWAVLVSYSRVYLGVHYPGDILGGAIFGSLVGSLVYAVFKKLSKA